MARYSSIRAILAIAAVMKWKVHQMDVKIAFLNGVVEEEVYVEQPQGFETHDRQTHVCRLKKALYGLKQAPNTWYGRIDSFLMNLGFTKSKADPNLYYKVEDSGPVILLYVDELFLTGDEKLTIECKRKLVKFVVAARAILREDGKDPSRDLGPLVHSWDTWSGTKQSVPWQKTLVRPPGI
jgi:hypothetical protein